MIDDDAAAGSRWSSRWAWSARWSPSRPAASAPGTPGSSASTSPEYLQEAGFSTEQLNRGGYTITTTLDRNVLDKMRASLLAEVPADQPNVANNMAIVAPGADKHRVLAMASQPHLRAGRGARRRPATGCPTSRSRWAPARSTRSSPRPPRWRRGWASTTSWPCRPAGTPRRSTSTTAAGRCRWRNSGEYPERMSLTDALALSPNTAFIKLEEFTGVPDVVDMAVRLGMRRWPRRRSWRRTGGAPTARSPR